MERPIDFIEEVETRYPVTSATARGVQVWPFLRQVYFTQYFRSVMGRQPVKHVAVSKELKRVANLPYGLSRWFRRYECVFLSSPLYRRRVGGEFVDKHGDWMLRELGKDKVLTILNTVSEGGADYRRVLNPHEHLVSCDPFNFVAVWPMRFGPEAIVNGSVLDQINEEYGLAVDHEKIVGSFFRLVTAFTRMLKVWQPRVLLVACYYNRIHQAAVYAANRAGIQTVELQHGRINRAHPAYNVFCPCESTCFPRHLLCYGEYVRECFGGGNHLVPRENVRAVGSGYIDYVRSSEEDTSSLQDALSGYRFSVAVTSIVRIDDEIIAFVKSVAARDDSILYVFIPRNWDRDYAGMGFPANVRLFPELDFYRIAKHADFHATVHSTTALEAPALGTPNILIDIEGMARSYIADLLDNEEVTKIVSTEEDFVRTVKTWQPKPREEIVRIHSRFFEPNHVEKVRNFLATLAG